MCGGFIMGLHSTWSRTEDSALPSTKCQWPAPPEPPPLPSPSPPPRFGFVWFCCVFFLSLSPLFPPLLSAQLIDAHSPSSHIRKRVKEAMLARRKPVSQFQSEQCVKWLGRKETKGSTENGWLRNVKRTSTAIFRPRTTVPSTTVYLTSGTLSSISLN